MHKQTQYFNCSEQVMRRLWKKNSSRRLSHSSTSLSLIKQRKRKIDFFAARKTSQWYLSSFSFFILTELNYVNNPTWEKRGRIYTPLSMTLHIKSPCKAYRENGIIHFNQSALEWNHLKQKNIVDDHEFRKKEYVKFYKLQIRFY